MTSIDITFIAFKVLVIATVFYGLICSRGVRKEEG